MQPPQTPNSGSNQDPVPGFGPRGGSANGGTGHGNSGHSNPVHGNSGHGAPQGHPQPQGQPHEYPQQGQAQPQGQAPAGSAPRSAAPKSKPSGGLRGGLSGKTLAIIIAAVVVVIALIAALVFFVFTDRSPEARAKKDIQSTLQNLSEVTSVEEFSSQICEEYRPDADVMNSLSEISNQSGVNFDEQFTEQIRAAFPASLEVDSVELDGENATAHVVSSDDEGASTDEDVQMRSENDAWLVCDPAVGTGGLPASQ